MPLTIDESLNIHSVPPSRSSRNRHWGEALTVDIHAGLPSFIMEGPPKDHHLVVCMTSGSGHLEQFRSGKTYKSVVRAGDVLVLPAGQAAVWRGATPENLRMRIPSQFMEAAWSAAGLLSSRKSELQSVYRTRDPFLTQLAALFTAELGVTHHPAQQLIVESASAMVASHLVRKYCTFAEKRDMRRSALSPYVVSQITDYVEAHLGTSIRLQDLAALAGVTPFHFARVFKASTGVTPIQFVDCARMRRACCLLQIQPKKPVEEIGRLVGFSNASHFTRRFTSHHGQTPSEYRKTIC